MPAAALPPNLVDELVSRAAASDAAARDRRRRQDELQLRLLKKLDELCPENAEAANGFGKLVRDYCALRKLDDAARKTDVAIALALVRLSRAQDGRGANPRVARPRSEGAMAGAADPDAADAESARHRPIRAPRPPAHVGHNHENAPWGVKDDGTPYTEAESRAALRQAIRNVYGLDSSDTGADAGADGASNVGPPGSPGSTTSVRNASVAPARAGAFPRRASRLWLRSKTPSGAVRSQAILPRARQTGGGVPQGAAPSCLATFVRVPNRQPSFREAGPPGRPRLIPNLQSPISNPQSPIPNPLLPRSPPRGPSV